jgi:uncharacterized phage-like protein YoqJ
MIIAGTGHRPDDLYGGYTDEGLQYLIWIAESALMRYKLIHKQHVDRIIAGGALGWDTALACAAIKGGYPLSIYVPFVGQEKMWPEKSQNIYNKTLELADEVKIVCEGGYAAWKMQKRNEAMVNDCDRVLALWAGTPGGTGNCVNYANKVEKPIDNCWDSYIKRLPKC